MPPTVTVGGSTYTFVNAAPTSAYEVEVVTSHGSAATNETDTAINLNAAINAASTCNAPNHAGCYGTGTSANTSVSATQSGAVVSLTAKTTGASSDFTLSTNSTADITSAGSQNGTNSGYVAEDLIFFSVFEGAETGCTDYANNTTEAGEDGCVLSYNVTTPSSIALSGTALNVVANPEGSSIYLYHAPTGGLVVDNLVSPGTMAGASEFYFLSTDSSGTCTTAGTGVCATQTSQTSP